MNDGCGWRYAMKRVLTVTAILMVALGSATADTASWSGAADNDDWVGGPWWQHEPTSSDLARINDGNWWADTGPHVRTGMNAYADSMEIGMERKDGNGYLFIDGGQLDVTGVVKLGLTADTTTGTIIVNTGTMNIGGNLAGWYGGATVDVHGGRLNVGGWLVLGQFDSAVTRVNLHGGELEALWIGKTAAADGVLNIEEGTFIISQTPDKQPALQALIDAGTIVAYNGDPSYELVVSWDGTDNRIVAVKISRIATIVDSSITNNMMKMVVHAPGVASNYYPKASIDLEDGMWAGVAHSDNGVNAFMVTNLDYAASDASGTNKVIYLQVDDAKKFFKVGGNEP